ncbi:MAG: hypothetical protein AAF466_11825, partial [Bacteroidota bacterium]
MNKFLSLSMFALLFLSFTTAFAQQRMDEEDSSMYLSNKPITIVAAEQNYAGSAYENEEFVNGYVFKDGKILASNVALRYNAKRDEVEVKPTISSPDANARVMVKNSDIYIKILNKAFVYSPKQEGIEKAGYFIVLHEGDHYALYKKISKKFYEGKESVNSITRDTPPSYRNVETYFLVDKENGNFTLFPKS